MNRVLWLNSLPPRFKKEILDKLISENINLSMNDQYKIMVDFGQIAISHNLGPREKQEQPSPQRRGSQSPRAGASQSPIRVTVEHIKKAQTNFIDLEKQRKKMLSRAEKQRLLLDAEYDEYLNLAAIPQSDKGFIPPVKQNKVSSVAASSGGSDANSKAVS